MAIAILTRFTLLMGVVFFFVEFLRKRLSLRQFSIILLLVTFSCVALGLYNQRRFHSFFETGYNYSINIDSFPLSENLQYGVVSPLHIPANLYSFLIMAPEPVRADPDGFLLQYPYVKANPWGMAIWYTSPLFLFLIFRFRKSKHTLSLALASVATMVPIFTYFSVGFIQFGYRYTLDILPFLFVLLTPSLTPKLSKAAIALIVIGVLFNLIYADSLFGIYPLLGIL